MIEKTHILDAQRADFLPKYFGQHHFLFETYVYNYMSHFCEQYKGGFWNFYSLSNGGMFIAPSSDETFRVVNFNNHCDQVLSAEAAGIGVTLYALYELNLPPANFRTSSLYSKLRDFAFEHAEARGIYAFID